RTRSRWPVKSSAAAIGVNVGSGRTVTAVNAFTTEWPAKTTRTDHRVSPTLVSWTVLDPSTGRPSVGSNPSPTMRRITKQPATVELVHDTVTDWPTRTG